VSLVSSGLLLVFGLNLAVRDFDIARAEEAVVIQSLVQVRSAPLDDEALTLFTVHEGTKVRVDRRSEAWAEVVLEDGKVGWVPVDVFETI
jgi:SH3-like domain-containing protein